MALRDRTHARLIAREDELIRLDVALSQAADGEPATVLIEGPPGIGKTALLHAVDDRALDHSATVLHARGSELEQDLAFGVLSQLLPEAAPASGASFIAVLTATQDRLRELTAAGLVVLVVDDAHWADEPSLRLLSCLCARLPAARLAMALASRPEGPRQISALAALRREAEVLLPAELAPEACAQVLSAIMHGDDDPPSAELERAAHQATGGNPFLVNALGRELSALPVRERRIAAVAQLAPSDVIDVLTARLLDATPEMRRLAHALAVLGDDPDRRFAPRLAGLDQAAASVAADALVGLYVLAPGAGLTLIHPLIRPAVLAGLPAGESAGLHARAAGLLAEEDAAPESVAAHLLATFPAQDQGVIDALLAAADAAERRGAPSLGIPFLRRALLEGPVASERVALVIRLAVLEARSGDEQAEHRLTQALELCGDRGTTVDLALELSLFLHLAGDGEGAADAIRRAAASLDPADRERRLALASVRVQTGRRFSTQTPAEAELGFEEEELTGATEGECALLVNLAMAEVLMVGHSEHASELARRAVSRQADGALSVATADVPAVLAMAGHTQEALDGFDRGIAAAEARGDLPVLVVLLSERAYALRRLGRLTDALEDSARGDQLARETGAGFHGLFATAFLMEGLCDHGRLTDAETALVRAEADGPLPGGCHTALLLLVRARLRAAQGRADDAIADLELLGERAVAADMDNPAFTPWRSALAALVAERGDRARARALVAEELAMARMDRQPRGTAVALLAGARLTAPSRRGGPLREALSLAERAGEPVLVAEIQHETGRWMLERGELEPAREVLRRALDAASRCDALVLADAVRSTLQGTGARPRRTSLSGPGALTPAERRVASLAAAGASNATIAAELVVVARTVELHLTNAYRKLGVGSRAELAAALREPV